MITDIVIINPPQYTPYNAATIRASLNYETNTAGHGEKFNGRPVTSIINDGHHVVKLRGEYQLNRAQSQRLVEQFIDKETRLQSHHPDKTWFLLIESGNHDKDAAVLIGNITPYLTPLDHSSAVLKKLTTEDYVLLLGKLLDKHLQIAANHKLCLDISLSNFAVDEQNALYYIDDELYEWDEFNSLPDFLAVLLRSQTWLNEKLFRLLGHELHSCIIKHFKDPHWITVIAEQLRGLFIPDERRGQQKSFIDALYSEQTFHYQPRQAEGRIALLADIHANAPALITALDFIDSNDIKQTLVLGDIVGYGPHPNECIALLRDRDDTLFIRGNHDHAVITGNLNRGITSHAGWALNWTIENIKNEYRTWLEKLPAYLQHNNWLAVHGAPKDKTFFNGYVYQMTYSDNLDDLQQRNIPICFHGHTHTQNVYYRSGNEDQQTDATKLNLDIFQGSSPNQVGRLA